MSQLEAALHMNGQPVRRVLLHIPAFTSCWSRRQGGEPRPLASLSLHAASPTPRVGCRSIRHSPKEVLTDSVFLAEAIRYSL